MVPCPRVMKSFAISDRLITRVIGRGQESPARVMAYSGISCAHLLIPSRDAMWTIKG